MAITFTERYVTASASGGGTGTQASPWTFAEALTNAAAGDRVNVQVGTYAGDNTQMTADGTRTSPIVFRGYQTTIGDLDDNTDALVDGTEIPYITGAVDGGGFNTCNWTFLNHLSFRTTKDYNNNGWIVKLVHGYARRCKFVNQASGAGSNNVYAITTGDTTNFYDCYIASYGTSYGLSNGKANHSVGNTFEYLGTSARGSNGMLAYRSVGNTYIRLNTGMTFSYEGNPILVNDCTFYDCSVGVRTNPSVQDYARTRTIANCYFANCTTGIASNLTDNSGFHVVNCGFYNNTNNVGPNVPLLVNPKYDTSDPFVDSANYDLRLVSGSSGYGTAFPQRSYKTAELNNRDVGSMQHADPSASSGGSSSTQAGTQVYTFRQWVEDDFGSGGSGGGATIHPLYAN